jgi:hyperosmotically inducible protein
MTKPSQNPGQAQKTFGLILSLGATSLLLGVTGCAGNRYTQSTGEQIDDRVQSSHVKKALSDDPQYKYGNVKVQTFKGVVQLSGFANSSEQKDRAAALANNVVGVREVVNNITIKESGNNTPYFTTSSPSDADNTTRNDRNRDNQTIAPFDQGSSRSDVAITAQIRRDITAEKTMSVSARNVRIVTVNGRVSLRGPVNTTDEKRIIGDIASRIARSANVDNQLEVTLAPTGR